MGKAGGGLGRGYRLLRGCDAIRAAFPEDFELVPRLAHHPADWASLDTETELAVREDREGTATAMNLGR